MKTMVENLPVSLDLRGYSKIERSNAWKYQSIDRDKPTDWVKKYDDITNKQ